MNRRFRGSRGRLLVAAVLAVVLACPAAAQVFKCQDNSGKTTYQQKPCAGSQTGSRVNATPANASTPAADSGVDRRTSNTGAREIAVGMTRELVAKAVGTPQTMRPGTKDEGVAEVWVYKRPDFSALIGFKSGRVAWRRDNAESRDSSAEGDAKILRPAVVMGRDCQQLVAEIGAPESVTQLPREGSQRNPVRFVWEPRPDVPERTTAICLDGLVTQVERVPVVP